MALLIDDLKNNMIQLGINNLNEIRQLDHFTTPDQASQATRCR